MIGRDMENPALKAFIRGLGLVLLGLGIETYARLFLKLNEIGLTALDRGNGAVKRTRRVCLVPGNATADLFRLWPGSFEPEKYCDAA